MQLAFMPNKSLNTRLIDTSMKRLLIYEWLNFRHFFTYCGSLYVAHCLLPVGGRLRRPESPQMIQLSDGFTVPLTRHPKQTIILLLP